MTLSALPSVCVIGAGSSGIAALKELARRGFHVTGFEAGDRVGGNWVYRNANGMSSAYDHLHINTSRERMQYSDFPMPRSFPDFPHHTHIASYFDDYVDHFGFRDRIRFHTTVTHARRGHEGGWEVDVEGAEGAGTEHYDVLAVANGHHWDPRWPEPAFPGTDDFDGEVIHSHSYEQGRSLDGRDVVVLGMGNSAMDIAVEASYRARGVTLAARRGAWIVPKYVFGRPVDQIAASPRVPFKIRQALFNGLLRFTLGRVEDYGLHAPDHRFGDAHPTISADILNRVVHGKLDVKPNIARLDGDRVHFVDGTSVHADLVVFCTGYKISFPFFDPDLIAAPDNQISLFKRVFHPDHPDLAFLGLLQPLGAVMPIAEAQSRWLAEYLRGGYALPSPDAMRVDMRRDRERMAKRYVTSKRHTIQVDFDDYLVELERERKAGRKRAAGDGFRLPVPPERRLTGSPS